MKHIATQASTDGIDLAIYSHSPSGDVAVRAVLLIVHGFAEHAMRYEPFTTFLGSRGICSYAVDLRGHGRSGGERAFIRSMLEYADDLSTFETFVRSRHPDAPLFYLGHSNGGLTLINYLLDRQTDPIAGVVLSAPALKIDPDLSPLLKRLTPFIGKIAPRLKAIKLDSRLISRDPDVVRTYDTDPLVYREGIKAGYAAAILKSISQARRRFPELSAHRFLILHGAADKLTDPEGSRYFAETARSSDLTFEILPDYYHEILNDLGKESVYQRIADWIGERTG